MAGYFTVASKVKLADLDVGTRIEESDFATLDNSTGMFVQLKYHESDETKKAEYKVKPGVFVIKKTMAGFILEPTSFVKDSILEQFAETQDIEKKADCFFNKISVYKELGFEVPKRAMLIYGPAGTGKSTNINKVCRKYVDDGKTAVVVWPTDAYEAYDVKEFIKTFVYEGVEKLIFVAEDIGGVEMEHAKVRSDSSMLALLDNQEKTFTIPVLIMATTNHPEMFLANLTNRPNRFDDKIKAGYPKPEFRLGLLEFFAKNVEISEEAKSLIKSSKCEGFSPAHIREVIIRTRIYDMSVEEVIKRMISEIEDYKKAFADKKSSGMGMGASWDD